MKTMNATFSGCGPGGSAVANARIVSFWTRILSLVFLMTISVLLSGQVWGQINYTFNFDANSTGWTGDFTRFTGATACGGAGGAMRKNLYSGATTGQLISPTVGTSNGASATISYTYKAAVWSANTSAASSWGTFNVQYGATATGPWTTFATVTNEVQLGNACISKSHTVTLPAGATFIRFAATYQSGDYYLNFDNVSVVQSAGSACSGTPNPGNTISSAASVGSGSTVNLSLQNATAGSGVTYQWQSGPSSSGPWTNFGTSAATQTSPAITAATWFRCRVTCGANTGNSNPVQVTLSYCTPTNTNNGDYISSFSTSGGTLNVSSSGTGTNALEDYTAQTVSQFATGSVSFSGAYAGGSAGFSIWVDWNNNLVFDASELMFNATATAASWTGSFVVPAGQALGNYRMRIRAQWNTLSPPACGAIGYGQAEDYTLTVIAAPACAQTPSGLSVSVTSSTTANVSWSAASPAPSSGYQYAVTTSATPPASGTGTTSTSATVTGLTANTTYYLHVRSNCNGTNFSNWVTSASFFTGYCVPSSSQSGEFIDVFNTTGGITNISNSATGMGSSPIGYQDLTAQSCSQSAGGTINFSANIPNYAHGLKIWVDWNNDLDFLDAGESVYTSASVIGGSTTAFHTGSFNVPAGQAIGNYRMRVRSMDWVTSADLNSCNAVAYGECEDYTFTVAAPPACLSPLTPSGTPLTLTSATVSWTAPSPAPTGGYEYAITTSATPPASGTATTATSLTVTGLSTNTTFYLHVRSNCGASGFSTWATSASFRLGYCIPVTSSGCTEGDVVARVVLNTLDNNSGTGCPSGLAGYSDYTSDASLTTTLLPSTTYNCTVFAGQYSQGYAAWIDYNDDGVFDNATERIGFSNGLVSGSGIVGVLGSSAVFPISLACNPPAGPHRLRVRSMYNTNGIDVTPCGSNTWGETEDYTITIAAAPACPSPGLVTTLTPAFTSASITFATGCSAATNYDFEYGPAGFTLGNGTLLSNQTVSISAPNASYTLTGLTAGTNYTVYYRANCGATQSTWSIANNFSTQAIPVCVSAPTSPANASSLCESGSATTLSWPSIANATVYDVYFNTGSSATTLVSANLAGTTYNVGVLSAGNYAWRIVPKNGSTGPSGCSDFTFTVNPVLNASVSIVANNTTACSGVSVTFTATPTNGGSAPSYAWFKNGSPIAGASGASYSGVSGTDFVNGDVITVVMTSNATPCLVGSPATSNGVTMTVNTPVPSNTDGTYASGSVNIADGTTVEFLSSCVAIGKTTDASGGNVPGNTTMTATVVSTMQSTNPDGWKYVRRSYTSTTASDGQRTLTFYFTQEDFDDYNANNYGSMDLPTSGNNSDPNKPYIRLVTVTSSGYTVSASLGVNLTWNGTYWQLTKMVPSVNGATYYISTQSSCEGVLVNGLAAGNISATNATLTWTAISPNPSSGYYQLRYKPTASSTWVDGGTANYLATSKTYSTLSPGTQYEFQIRRVCSSDGFGAWSSSVIFNTISSGCGSPMVFNAPTSTSSSVTLSWPAVSGAAWFQFQYKESSSGTWLSAGTITGTGTTRTVSGLNPNTSYDFRGRTYCPNNVASAWSTTVTTTTTGQSGCDLPPALTVSSVTSAAVTVTWPAVQGAGWYEFRYKENSAGTWTNGGTASGTATSKTISGLTADANYIIQARTYCSNGTPSNWSSSTTFGTTGDEPCETAPVLTVASVSNTSATITWPAVSGAAWYEFRYKASASSTWISCGTLSGTGTTRVLSGLTANTQYDFQAKTFCPNGGESSAWSSTLQFTTTGAAAIAINDDNGMESSEGQSTKEMAINEVSGVAVNVFPNPTDDLVQVQVIIEQANETLVVRVFDMSGRLVQEAQAMTEGGLTTIPLSMGEMMTGMYNVELYQNGALIHRARVQKN